MTIYDELGSHIGVLVSAKIVWRLTRLGLPTIFYTISGGLYSRGEANALDYSFILVNWPPSATAQAHSTLLCASFSYTHL